jgi:hypothetical protein
MPPAKRYAKADASTGVSLFVLQKDRSYPVEPHLKSCPAHNHSSLPGSARPPRAELSSTEVRRQAESAGECLIEIVVLVRFMKSQDEGYTLS